MTLEADQPTPKQTRTEAAIEIAKKYNDLPFAAARNKVKEEAHVSRTTASKAVTIARAKEKVEEAKEPEIKVVAEPAKEPAFLEEQKAQTLEGLEEIPQPQIIQKVMAEGELSPEDLQSLFEAANEAIGSINENRRPSDKSAKILGKLWHKPFNQWYSTVSEKNPLLVIAVLITIMVYAPSLIGCVIDWRASKKKPEQLPKK